MHAGRPPTTLDGLHDELARVLQVDVSDMADDELLEAVADVYRLEARTAALKATLVAEMDARQAFAAVGAQTAAAWIRHRCRVPDGLARHDVQLARSLRHLPATEAKLADGDIGEAQATSIARCHRNLRTEEAAERDEELLATHASQLTWSQFKTVVAYWKQRADPDGTDDDAEARKARRQFTMLRTFEGCWVADGLLDPVDGTIVDTEIRRLAEELYRADRATGDPLRRTAGQRRADAVVEMARRSSSASANGKRPRPLVTVLVDSETFAGRVCELADGTVVAPSDVSALLDEAVIERAVFDGPSRVLEIGEKRLFTGALRRAIELRDRTCTHPYCEARAEWCDGDHRRPWIDDGPTTQWNGRLLCPFHNHLRQKATRRGPPVLA